MIIYFLIFLLIGCMIGYLLCITLNSSWSKWKDISIVYDSTEYQWKLLQIRSNTNGNKEFRTINVVKYCNMTKEIQEIIEKEFDR